MLMGEIDLDRDGDEFVPGGWRRGDVEEVKVLRRQEEERRKSSNGRGLRALKKLGFEGERLGEAVL